MPPCLPIITFTLSSYFESIKVTRTLHLLDDFPGERSAESATRIFRYARDSLDITRVLTRNCRLAGTRRGVLHKTEEENDRATSSFLAGSGRARRSAPSRTRRDPAASSSNCVNVTCTHSRKELEKLKRMMLFDNVLLHLLITRSARGDNRTSQLALAHFFGIAVQCELHLVARTRARSPHITRILVKFNNQATTRSDCGHCQFTKLFPAIPRSSGCERGAAASCPVITRYRLLFAWLLMN